MSTSANAHLLSTRVLSARCHRAACAAVLLVTVSAVPAHAATAPITQAATAGFTTGTVSSPIGGSTRARSMTRSISTPHMAMSISNSQVVAKTAGGPGGVLVGHAISHDRSMALDTAGRIGATATVSASARADGAPNAQGSLSVSGGGSAQATAPGASASAQDSATASIGGGTSAPAPAPGASAAVQGTAGGKGPAAAQPAGPGMSAAGHGPAGRGGISAEKAHETR